MAKNPRNCVGFAIFIFNLREETENISSTSSFLYTALNEQNKIYNSDYRSLIMVAEKLGLSESTAHAESVCV